MPEFTNQTGQLIIEKYLPHNFLAEKIILSSLLISSEAIEIVFRNVRVEAFYFKNHQELYKAIIHMYNRFIKFLMVFKIKCFYSYISKYYFNCF